MDGKLRFGCLWSLLIAFLATSALSAPTAASAAGCYAQVALVGGQPRFSAAPQMSAGSVALTIHRYRRALMVAQAPVCAPKAIVGHAYKASLRYTSTTSAVSLELLTHSAQGWRVWYVAASRLRPTSKFTSASVLLRPIQGGVDRVALGLLLRGSGTARVEGFSLIDVSLHTPASPEPLVGGSAPAGTPSGGGATSNVLGGVGSLVSPPLETTNPPSPPLENKEPAGSKEPKGSEEPTGFAQSGRWTVLEGIDHARSVHAVLLQNGKLLIMAGSGNSRMEFEKGSFRSFIYDPVANTWKELKTPKDVFCSGHVQLADGNVLILGGTSAYPPETKPGEYPSTVYKGENMSWIFNIHSEEYEQVPYDEANPSNPNEPGPLLSGTWYPSATELGNGDVISFGGLNEQGNGTTDTNYYTDPSNEGTNGDKPGEWVGWGSTKLQQTYSWFWGLYPSMILTADGRLFYDGSHVFGNGLEGEPQAPSGSSLYDFNCIPGKTIAEEEEEQKKTNPNAEIEGPPGIVFKRVTDTPGLREPDMRDQSASLLLPPAQSQKVMIMGGGNTYEPTKNALDLTDEINLQEKSPQWVAGPNLPRGTMEDGSMEPEGAGKMYVSAVALPDGSVLETGGSLHPRTENVHEASIFDPTTNSFAEVAADPVGRNYHSEALLLPDGRVIALGSNPADPATGAESFETRISIYEPPYLFKGSRPVLQLIDGEANTLEGAITKTKQWEYGTEHTLSYSSASPISSAVLIRPAAVTHSSDPNQREVALPIVKDDDGELTVSLTGNDNIAPPGYYMVFLVNSKGVPSVAQWVHVGPQGAPTG
jgi:hypothetical protein